ncbi:hypothetical protein [Salinisphaera sp. G21_0]|uniref:hypothetical protein n=1 Tax=Salinisphaera sp. G21_0 TaxID=2821094 RepID=UPI001AD95307|nr:hypothetical protein [Salinisphaera sp. G21_0]MBO9483137.1 hypothetical protein [Salinisphaera sp. G21_0]
MLKRWLLVLPAIALLAVALNTAFNLIRSEIWRYQTQDFLEFWQAETKADSNYKINQRDFDVTVNGIDKALNNAPFASELRVLKARVLELGFRHGLTPTQTVEPVDLTAWREAVLARPAWPYSWSAYAQARSQHSLIDPQFEAALVRADELGPWEQKVMEREFDAHKAIGTPSVSTVISIWGFLG